jgi:hypothetical protein
MRFILVVGVICMAAFSSFAQYAQSTFAVAKSGPNRLELVKSSIDLAAWHEASFWPLYEAYMTKIENVSENSYRSLRDLASMDNSISDGEAFQNALQVIASRYEALAVRKQYYTEVGSALNGRVALQFLQTELLMDMMESSRIYDESRLQKYRFHPKALPTAQYNKAKRNMITSALSLTADQKGKFWAIYSKYEEECDALLGENYNVIGLYAGEASDYTPAIAKRLGSDFLTLTEREIKLKEKFFNEMNAVVGSSLAARFLAWEDYYSLVSKMYAWADNP